MDAYNKIQNLSLFVDVTILPKYGKEEADALKKELYHLLLKENCFWSYDMTGVEMIPDDKIILNTLIHLDLKEINVMFQIWDWKYIKKVWREQMAIQGDYYRTLNHFLAWWYFKIKEPRKYLKMIETKHINSFCV